MLNLENLSSTFINSWFQSKNKVQTAGNEGITLGVANQLFATKNLKISENYFQNVKNFFIVSSEQLPFGFVEVTIEILHYVSEFY